MGRQKAGFTLTELLIVVAVIVILIAILIPSLESAMAASQRSKCASNLGQLGKAVSLFVNDSKTNLYPRTLRYYMVAGQLGQAAGYNDPAVNGPDKRPLNKYLGFSTLTATTEIKLTHCPSDKGGQAVLDSNNDRVFTAAENVYLSTGSSYVDAYGSFGSAGGGVHLARTGIAFMFGTDPNQPANAKPAASKVLMGDAPLHGENKYGDYGSIVGDKRNRWHGTDPAERKFNILFADSHVEFFNFGNPSKKGPDNIENTDGNGTPLGNGSNIPNPKRGFW